jgi:hypothetical protein
MGAKFQVFPLVRDPLSPKFHTNLIAGLRFVQGLSDRLSRSTWSRPLSAGAL